MNSSEDCIFCKIVSGEIPASVIFEDDVSMAFMDIFPVTKGHCLLIPTKHYENLFDVDLDVASHLARKLAELTQSVNRAFNPEGVLNVVANGPGAGQEVPHLHFHVIPRSSGASFGFKFPDNYRDSMAPRDELESNANLIKTA
ncbi:MAG: HIT family protein [Candidatus Thorarchaeota archaeon]